MGGELSTRTEVVVVLQSKLVVRSGELTLIVDGTSTQVLTTTHSQRIGNKALLVNKELGRWHAM